MRDVYLTRPLHLTGFTRNTRFRIGPDFECHGTPQPWAAVVTHGYDLWDCEIVGEFEKHPSDLGGTMASGQPWSVSGVAMTGRQSKLIGVSITKAPQHGLFFGDSVECSFRYVTLSRCFNGIFGEWWGNWGGPTGKLPVKIHGADFSVRDLWGYRLTDQQMASSGLWKGYPAGFSNYFGREHVVGNDGLVGIFQDSLFERFSVTGEMKAAIKFSQATRTTVRSFHAAHLMNQGTFSPPKPHPDGNPTHTVFWSQYIPIEEGTVTVQDGVLDPRLCTPGFYDLGGSRYVIPNVIQASFPGETRLENVTIFQPDDVPGGHAVALQSYLSHVTGNCTFVRRDPNASEPFTHVYPPEHQAWIEPKPGGVLVPYGPSQVNLQVKALLQSERA